MTPERSATPRAEHDEASAEFERLVQSLITERYRPVPPPGRSRALPSQAGELRDRAGADGNGTL